MRNISVLFENDRLIAIDKPPGILVIPDRQTDAGLTLLGEVSRRLGRKAWVVHR